jgi:hypothetical protein
VEVQLQGSTIPVFPIPQHGETLMRKFFWVPAIAVALAAACTAEQTREGEMPEVDVRGGQMPAYDVDPANVTVTQDTQRVITPEVNVTPAPNP